MKYYYETLLIIINIQIRNRSQVRAVPGYSPEKATKYWEIF